MGFGIRWGVGHSGAGGVRARGEGREGSRWGCGEEERTFSPRRGGEGEGGGLWPLACCAMLGGEGGGSGLEHRALEQGGIVSDGKDSVTTSLVLGVSW